MTLDFDFKMMFVEFGAGYGAAFGYGSGINAGESECSGIGDIFIIDTSYGHGNGIGIASGGGTIIYRGACDPIGSKWCTGVC